MSVWKQASAREATNMGSGPAARSFRETSMAERDDQRLRLLCASNARGRQLWGVQKEKAKKEIEQQGEQKEKQNKTEWLSVVQRCDV